MWADCVAWGAPEQERKSSAVQDETGRMWDVLMCAMAAARNAHDSARTTFTVHRVPPHGDTVDPRPAELALTLGPGDDADPVFTILMANED